jgi:hypothetical protein
MRVLPKRSEPEQLRETVGDSLGAVTGGLTRGKILTAGAVAGVLAALTAGSAGISSLRRRLERTGGNHS